MIAVSKANAVVKLRIKVIFLYVLTGVLFLISLIANFSKTKESLLIGIKGFSKMILPLCLMLVFVSLILILIPDSVILNYLSGENIVLNFIYALVIGSIIIIPGVAAFPLSKHLLDLGVSYGVLSAFTTALMLVGVLTFHIEKKFLGAKLAFIRNLFAFIICVVVAICTEAVFRLK